jgi:transcriptional regulator with XRE-family HTH domain
MDVKATLRAMRDPLKQEEMALRCGVSQPTISRIEAGGSLAGHVKPELLAAVIGEYAAVLRERLTSEPLIWRSLSLTVMSRAGWAWSPDRTPLEELRALVGGDEVTPETVARAIGERVLLALLALLAGGGES